MAVFSNQATLTYNGNTTNSNVTYGEIIDVLTATKSAVENTYAPGQLVTYAVALRNTGTTALVNLAITDDLGGYAFDDATVYPLEYVNGSVNLFVDGVLQPAPAVNAGPPLQITGISIPAGGDAVVVYQARVNAFANPAAGSAISNTATITGGGLTTPVTATETIFSSAEPLLSISKAVSPVQVAENGRLTYTFVIQNAGSAPVVATDDAVITDLFTPVLTDLAVTFDGVAWTQGVQYAYNEGTGLFTTLPGQITVPAATWTQNPVTGAYTITPGTATLTVAGTV